MCNSKIAIALSFILCYNGVDKITAVAGLEVINRNMAYRRNLDVDYIVSEYLAGKSVKALAEELHVARRAIGLRLKNSGITPRNRSESMYNRMNHTSPEERKRLAEAANKAKRGKPNTPEMLHKRALARKRFIGMFEQEFIDAISAAGIPVVPQEPFLSYNLDIGCGDIAVEIHTQTYSPLAARYVKKLMNCVNAGRSMIYVWINPQRIDLTDACYQQVIAIIKAFRSDPPARSKYWVVRGTGELYATGSFDGD
jgi:hypothetical protein